MPSAGEPAAVARRPFVVALTGGIAAGKSRVSACFAALGAAVYDADVAARDIVAPDTPGLAAVVAAFGRGVLDAGGQLDRAALRRRIFADPVARQRLDAITHPLIGARLRAQVRACRQAWCLLVIPLLAETWPEYAWVDRVAVVEAPRAARLQRLMRRDRVDRGAAERALLAQASDAQRRRLADDLIDNSGDAAGLEQQVRALASRYARLARQPGRTGAS